MKSYFNHPQKQIKLYGQEVWIDEGIADIVQWMAGIPGVQTNYSCQGDEGPNAKTGGPYVQVDIDDIRGLREIALYTGPIFPNSMSYTATIDIDGMFTENIRACVKFKSILDVQETMRRVQANDLGSQWTVDNWKEHLESNGLSY